MAAKSKRKAKKKSPSSRRAVRTAVQHSLLYSRLLNPTALWSAWNVVYSNARASKNRDTRREAENFKVADFKHIQRILGQLRRGTFRFLPARPVVIKKGNGGKRPLVVAPIPSRIVQRAILDVLHGTPRISAILSAGFNFGGVPGKGSGVPGAVDKVWRAAATYQHYFRTDIRSFFRMVNRERAISAVLDGIEGEDFKDIVGRAVNVELTDSLKHEGDVQLFPLWAEGVAQGSCLSPLLCNVLLHEFDVSMQGRGVKTIRYIDDFVVVGETAKKAEGAFGSAITQLKALGLECYDPRDLADQAKAEMGSLQKGLEFLGCSISTQAVRPSKSNVDALVQKIELLVEESEKHLSNPALAQRKGVTYLETLAAISATLRGWSNTFSFCTDVRVMRDVDRRVSELLNIFEQRVWEARGGSRMSPEDWRRYFGIWLAADATIAAQERRRKATSNEPQSGG